MATPSSPNPPTNPLPEETPPLPSSPRPESENQDQRHPADEEGEDGKKRREEAKRNEEWLQEMQGWLVVCATVVASVTYSAGVNVPGGFWQDDDSPARNARRSHAAGDPVLADERPSQYHVFFSCNASAFVSSMVVIMLLLKRSYFRSEFGLRLLLGSLIGCLISLVVAFCAASTRNRGDVLRVVYMLVSTFLWISLWSWVAKWLLKKKSSTTRPTSSRGTNV